MNMGGPRTVADVREYLQRIFLDRDIMQLPMQNLLGSFIASRRARHVEEEYKLIGGGSPIEKWTRHQGAGMVKHLDRMCPETGFRYSDPLTQEAVREIMSDQVKTVIAFSQYPQYSCSTTGSNLNELYRQIKLHDPGHTVRWSIIDR
ncbi:hypothetical protein EV182_006517, partial [Spiromyces aspiralis]